MMEDKVFFSVYERSSSETNDRHIVMKDDEWPSADDFQE